MLKKRTISNKPSFEIDKQIYLPVKESNSVFPLQSIYCVGRNYAAHSIEMGEDERIPPFFFSKASWAITNSDLNYPLDTKNLQYEVELVIAVGPDSSIFGFCIGVDLTRRDLQKKAKIEGKPWFRGKSFPGSAVVSPIILFNETIKFEDLKLRLLVNDKLKQNGSCYDMIWSPKEIMCQLSRDNTLKPGDLIFTGTPEGVGKLEKGDDVSISIPDYINHKFSIL